MHDILIYFLSAGIGGFSLGFIFLSFFDNLTPSHMYITIVGAIGFILNFFATAFFIEGPNIFRAFPGSLIYVGMFATFIIAGYLGRKERIKLRNKIFRRFKKGGDLADKESNILDSSSRDIRGS